MFKVAMEDSGAGCVPGWCSWVDHSCQMAAMGSRYSEEGLAACLYLLFMFDQSQ